MPVFTSTSGTASVKWKDTLTRTYTIGGSDNLENCIQEGL